MYSHTIHSSAANKKPLTSGAEFGEYSTLFSENKSEEKPALNIGKCKKEMEVDKTTQAAVHTQDNISYTSTQVDKKDENFTHCHMPDSEAATPVDQLYAQVDKRKKNTRSRTPEVVTPVAQLYVLVDMDKRDGNSTHCHTPGAAVPVDQLYAQVDKRKKKNRSRTPEVATPVAQLYAQVDKKMKSKGE
jgi:hypothetical protein